MLPSSSQGTICQVGITTETELPLPMVQAEVFSLLAPAWVMCCFCANHCGTERSDSSSVRGKVPSRLSESKGGVPEESQGERTRQGDGNQAEKPQKSISKA